MQPKENIKISLVNGVRFADKAEQTKTTPQNKPVLNFCKENDIAAITRLFRLCDSGYVSAYREVLERRFQTPPPSDY